MPRTVSREQRNASHEAQHKAADKITGRTFDNLPVGGVMKGSGHEVEVNLDFYPDDLSVVVVRYLSGPLVGKRRTVNRSSVRF